MNPIERFKQNREDKQAAKAEQEALEEEAMQQALETGEKIPISKEDFWNSQLPPVPPSIEISAEYVQETAEINKSINKFSEEDIRAAMFRKANELDSLYTKEIALSNISKQDKMQIRLAFQAAREVLTWYEFTSVEVQVYWFYNFAIIGYSLISPSRGEGGFTVKEMGTTRGYQESNINRRNRQSQDSGGFLGSIGDTFAGLFGGGH
jgi:hypothetical protein